MGAADRQNPAYHLQDAKIVCCLNVRSSIVFAFSQVYCSGKLYLGVVSKIVSNVEDWREATFYPNPPNDVTKRRFSRQYRVEVCVESVRSEVLVEGVITTVHTPTSRFGNKSVMFDKNLQKIVLGKHKREVREKEKQWNRCQEHKKLLFAAVWGQLDDDNQAQMELSPNYDTHREDGNIVEFLKSLYDICNGSDDDGLSYQPFKVVSALKLLNLFSSQDVTNVH